ncbi:Trans-1,2-dihydrobenzene-1,2-diol dehydrogenase [Aphelenchoides besseyi]|nr:Trans-1,2-dihydrobenzene-1,2-diol dehydrogenase [Aphelenchoides besseyi]KAI6236065.1 Trans-1,2-dihydrobenzene-1,2-diol dehydrogenase [Aphelenchoides besseyi]
MKLKKKGWRLFAKFCDKTNHTLTETLQFSHQSMSLDSTPLSWGVLGCGNICNDFLLAMEKAERNHKLVAIGSSNLEKSRRFLKDRNYDARAYGTYMEVLKDPNVQVVYIGLRNAEHFYFAMKALDNGKHVLCEKPLGVNTKQVKQMILKARAKRLFLMEGYWSRFFPVYDRIREIIASNELGQPRLVSVTLGYSLPPDFVDLNRGETMLTTLGCYAVAFAQFVFTGKPLGISYTGNKNAKGGDSFSSVRLEYGNDRDAVFLLDERHFLPNDAYIGFEHGCVKIHGNFWAPTEMTITNREVVEHKTFPLDDERTFNYPNSSALHFEADHVYDCIKSGRTESEIMTLEASQLIHETVDELRQTHMKISFPQDKMFIYDLMRTMSLTQ